MNNFESFETQYLRFCLIDIKPKTKVWNIENKKSYDILGFIKWYPAWRQYCVFFKSNVIFNKTCLVDVMKFLDHANDEHKQKRRKNKIEKSN